MREDTQFSPKAAVQYEVADNHNIRVGYNRAARMIERMEAEGLVTPANRVGKRDVLPPGGPDAD